MAPHWKCGSGQPVAGSNPALSATPSAARTPMRALSPAVLAHAPWGALAPVLGSAFASTPARQTEHPAPQPSFMPLTHDQTTRGHLVRAWARSGFRSLSCRIGRASSWATRSGTGVGSSCSIRGSGSATRSSTSAITRSPGGSADALAEAGIDDRGRDRRRQLPPACRPCRSELARSRTCRSTSRRPSGRSRTRPTTRSSSGSTFPAARYVRLTRRPRTVRRAPDRRPRPATRPATSRWPSRRTTG